MNGQSMRKIPGLYLALVLTSLLSACAGQGRPGLEKTAVEDDVGGKAEEVYVFRTTRMRHERGQTPACAPAPFTSANEDSYELWSIEVRTQDSRIIKDLSGLPDSYVGGSLVSSTLAPLLGANQPADAHVPGYLSTSVVSVRLWRKPDAGQTR